VLQLQTNSILAGSPAEFLHKPNTATIECLCRMQLIQLLCVPSECDIHMMILLVIGKYSCVYWNLSHNIHEVYSNARWHTKMVIPTPKTLHGVLSTRFLD